MFFFLKKGDVKPFGGLILMDINGPKNPGVSSFPEIYKSTKLTPNNFGILMLFHKYTYYLEFSSNGGD